MQRLVSLILFLAVWWIASLFAGPQMLPGPERVMAVVVAQARTGELFVQLGVTLARVACAFSVAISRIVLGMHFLSDVVVGSGLGVILAYCSYAIVS